MLTREWDIQSQVIQVVMDGDDRFVLDFLGGSGVIREDET